MTGKFTETKDKGDNFTRGGGGGGGEGDKLSSFVNLYLAGGSDLEHLAPSSNSNMAY